MPFALYLPSARAAAAFVRSGESVRWVSSRASIRRGRDQIVLCSVRVNLLAWGMRRG